MKLYILSRQLLQITISPGNNNKFIHPVTRGMGLGLEVVSYGEDQAKVGLGIV